MVKFIEYQHQEKISQQVHGHFSHGITNIIQLIKITYKLILLDGNILKVMNHMIVTLMKVVYG